jgi:hypothetical protein
VSPARISLIVEKNSLFLITGNLRLRLRKGRGISDLIRPGKSDFEEIPCIFPGDQGIGRRDEFAPDCPHRHPVCRCRDFPRTSKYSPRNSREFAGFWPMCPCESEPETAHSGLKGGRVPRISLLPSAAVRNGAPVDGRPQQNQTASWNPFRSTIEMRGFGSFQHKWRAADAGRARPRPAGSGGERRWEGSQKGGRHEVE